MPWTISDILEATGGSRVRGDLSQAFDRVSIDSRTISEGDLFVAIRGVHHDGHNFIGQIAAKNGKGFIVESEQAVDIASGLEDRKDICIVAVDDTVKALGGMAAFQRDRAGVGLVAITGSNGKTTTRGLTESVFRQKFSTLATMGNFNNEIGLPLTLLRLAQDHEWAVVEMGMNRPGEIKALTKIARPDIGIITNISAAHIEGLGSIEGVLQAKAELMDEMPSSGLAVLNAEDPRLVRLAENASRDVLLFGFSSRADVRATDMTPKDTGTVFRLTTPRGKADIHIAVPGEVMISNALASAAAGHAAGLDPDEIRDGIERFQPEPGRMNIIRTLKGITILDDTYNANPASMKTAVSTLCSLKGSNKGFLVAGDMLEMGSHAKDAHRDIGAYAARSGLSGIFATGQYAGDVAKGAADANMKETAVFTGSKEAIQDRLFSVMSNSDWILVKGSRGMKMETIVKKLKETGDNA